MARTRRAAQSAPQEVLVPEAEQPYAVPENWRWVRLGSINFYRSENVNPALSPDIFFELYSVPSSAEGYPEIAEGNNIGSVKQGVKKGDVLLCKINPRINRVWYVSAFTDNILVASSEWIVFRNNQIDYKFIAFYFLSPVFRQYMLSNVSGIGGSLMRARPKFVATYPVPLPPRAEQERIVARIESLFSRLDKAREKVDAVLGRCAARKAALLHKAFSGELTAAWRKARGIGLESWEQLTLNDVANYKKGPFGSSLTKSMFVPYGKDTYKVYEQGNAIKKTCNYGRYYISREKFKEMSSFSVRGGDIIVSCAGTIGELFKLPDNCEEGIINQALMRVRVFEIVNEKFFIYYFEGVLKSEIVDEANGTAIQNIPPFKVMKAMSFYLPCLQEQAEIVRILDELLARERRAQEAAERVAARIEQIKRAVLTKAFRGELGTNDPAEPAALTEQGSLSLA